MHIEALRRHPHLIDPIVSTLHASWGELPPWADPDAIRARLLAGTTAAPLPHTLVAVTDGGALAATGSVKLNELPGHPDKVHWIGEVFVLPAHRGQGLGSHMTRALTDHALAHGVADLYLYTPYQQSLYARLGWVEVDQDVVHQETVSVMKLAPGARR